MFQRKDWKLKIVILCYFKIQDIFFLHVQNQNLMYQTGPSTLFEP